MKIIFWLTLFLLSNTCVAEIVKCVDKHGKTHYSDHYCEKTASSAVFKANIGVFKPEEVPNVIALHTQPKFQPKPYSTPVQHAGFSYKSVSYQLIIGLYALMSVVCYLCYFIDKRAAVQGLWRIPEKSLHTLELLGGWPGALLAQRTLRHKNRKPAYQLVFWLIVGLHVVGLAQLR
jgi:uncharacterized membrane protein YsdA (DUF1294 family)